MARFDRVIPPGGEGKIQLVVQTKNYRGRISKSARVFTNDPVHNVLQVGLNAEILTYIDVRPGNVIMRGDGTKALTGEAHIVSQIDKPLEVTTESFSLEDKVSYTIEEIEKGKTFKITFETKAVPETGYQGYLKLKTNFSKRSELQVNVAVVIKKPPRIKLSHRTIRMRGGVGEEITGEVIIESMDDEPLSISPNKQTFPENVSYVIEEVEKGKQFKVRFVAEPARARETYQGSLTLKTNYKDQPTLRIHVVVLVR